jgi:hypothetical protein
MTRSSQAPNLSEWRNRDPHSTYGQRKSVPRYASAVIFLKHRKSVWYEDIKSLALANRLQSIEQFRSSLLQLLPSSQNGCKNAFELQTSITISASPTRHTKGMLQSELRMHGAVSRLSLTIDVAVRHQEGRSSLLNRLCSALPA